MIEKSFGDKQFKQRFSTKSTDGINYLEINFTKYKDLLPGFVGIFVRGNQFIKEKQEPRPKIKKKFENLDIGNGDTTIIKEVKSSRAERLKAREAKK